MKIDGDKVSFTELLKGFDIPFQQMFFESSFSCSTAAVN